MKPTIEEDDMVSEGSTCHTNRQYSCSSMSPNASGQLPSPGVSESAEIRNFYQDQAEMHKGLSRPHARYTNFPTPPQTATSSGINYTQQEPQPQQPRRSTTPSRVANIHTLGSLLENQTAAGGGRAQGAASSYGVASATETYVATTTATSGRTSYTEHVGQQQVLGEKIVETEIRIPTKRIVEETREKIVVIPETVRREETVEETKTIREKTIFVKQPVVKETIVEDLQVVTVEKTREVPIKVQTTTLREVPKITTRVETVYVPKIIPVMKEVPLVTRTYKEVINEKIVEVPQVVEHHVMKQIAVPRYVEVPIYEEREVKVEQNVSRNIPVPVENVITQEFERPQIEEVREKVGMPIYVPQFIEVAVPAEQLTAEVRAQCEAMAQEVMEVGSNPAPSLCQVEELGARMRNFDINQHRDESKLPPIPPVAGFLPTSNGNDSTPRNA